MSKWKITSNLIGDEKMYSVYCLRDENAVDHSGNRKFAIPYINSKEECLKIAEQLNNGGLVL